jgi:hypothetical protein
VAFSCFGLDAGAAHAVDAFKSGAQLFVECGDVAAKANEIGGAAAWGMCLGYIMGVADAREFCIPTELKSLIEAEQVKDVVKLYFRDHRENLLVPASDLVTAALKEKFPCN